MGSTGKYEFIDPMECHWMTSKTILIIINGQKLEWQRSKIELHIVCWVFCNVDKTQDKYDERFDVEFGSDLNIRKAMFDFIMDFLNTKRYFVII